MAPTNSALGRLRRPTGLALAALAWATIPAWTSACGPSGGTADDGRRPPGFEEVGRAAGLDFEMRFLEGEQGANFKINLYDHGAGVSVGDFDGDGFDDVYLVNQLGSNALFRNRGDGTFENVTERAGVGLADRICTSAAFADYDNDGDQDLFVASTRGGNVLFRQDAPGVFTDVTDVAGVALVAHSQGVTFFDYDRDGFLDLFVTNTADWTLDEVDPRGRYHVGPPDLLVLVESPIERNLLYRNRGDGSFENVTTAAGVAGSGWGGDTAVFDADGDGYPDLFVTNMFGRSTLYRNDEGKRFTDATAEMLGPTSWGTVGCKPFDWNGDGLLDLFLVDMHSDMWMAWGDAPSEIPANHKYDGPEGAQIERGKMTPETRAQLYEVMRLDPERLKRVVFGNTLFTNLGNGRFREDSDAAGLETLWPWAIAAADFDLDGFEDVFIAAGMGYPYPPWPNDLLMNRGGVRFESRAKAEGIDPRADGDYLDRAIDGQRMSGSSRSVAVMNFDGDGRPDLVVNNFNERAYLYRNRFPERAWVALRLRGTRSNRDAVGAVVRLRSGDTTRVRQVASAGGYLAQSSLTLFFGLGADEAAPRCEIDWPSGTRQVLETLEPGRIHSIVEPKSR